MKNKKWIKLVIVLTISISVFSLWILTYFIRERIYIRNNLVDNEFFHTVDNLDNNFENYKNRSSILEDLSKMNNMLHSSKTFEFIEMKVGSSFVFKSSYKANQSFADSNDDYNYSNELKNVKSIKVSNNAKYFFNIQIEDGDYFNENDYIYTDDTISIILGNSYKNFYKINDTINLMIYGNNIEAKVKGFLKQGSNVIYFNENVILDKFIMIPSEKFDKNYNIKNNFMHVFKVLLDRNNGIISPINKKENVTKELQNICQTVNLPYTLSINIDELYENNNKNIIFLSFIIAVNIILLIVLLQIKKK